jgi:RNA ligase
MASPKYNRTFHLPWSAGATNDDKVAKSVSSLIGVSLVITEKMDGSNVSLEHNACYARTHSSLPTHPSFDQLKSLHAGIKYRIHEDMQFFGEWCYAKHSIEYSALPGYFMMFGIRQLMTDDDDFTVSYWHPWINVEAFAAGFIVPTVPILLRNFKVKSEKELKEITDILMSQPSVCGGIREGVVVRLMDGFDDEDFSTSVMKCVRANHVQTDEHWKDQIIVKNKLKAP